MCVLVPPTVWVTGRPGEVRSRDAEPSRLAVLSQIMYYTSQKCSKRYRCHESFPMLRCHAVVPPPCWHAAHFMVATMKWCFPVDPFLLFLHCGYTRVLAHLFRSIVSKLLCLPLRGPVTNMFLCRTNLSKNKTSEFPFLGGIDQLSP